MLSCISIVAERQVQPELQELERYVHDALGATVKTAPWRGAGNLPPVLRERYRFAQAELLGLNALFVIDANPEEQPPATVRKHIGHGYIDAAHADRINGFYREYLNPYLNLSSSLRPGRREDR